MQTENENKITLSIIVPVYNVEKYLEDCVESLLNQTYQNYEIILVDDGSTDSSGKICEYCRRKLLRKSKLFIKKMVVYPQARNTGLRAARGRYIGFVDSDDYILPTMYEKLIYSMSRYKAQIVSCQYFTFCTNDILKEKVVETKGNRIQGKFCDKQEIFKFLFTHRISEVFVIKYILLNY